MADFETTVSPAPDMLVHNGLKLRAAARGVYFDTSATISGAAGALDFGGEAILRLTVTGNLSGSFTFPPTNVPPLEADNQSIILTVFFIQDSTGGRTINLNTLFADAAPNIVGSPLVDESAGGVTVVDIVARRAASATTYTVNFSPTFDASQIDSGLIDPQRLPTATPTAKGAVTLSPGSSAAAAGDHVHGLPLPAKITIRMSDGGAIPNGDYELLDMPTDGTVIRLTGLRLTAPGAATATVTAKISGTNVTGTGTSATAAAASADANATANNVFVSRQTLQVNVAGVTGSPTMLVGYLHYTVNTNVWVP